MVANSHGNHCLEDAVRVEHSLKTVCVLHETAVRKLCASCAQDRPAVLPVQLANYSAALAIAAMSV